MFQLLIYNRMIRYFDRRRFRLFPSFILISCPLSVSLITFVEVAATFCNLSRDRGELVVEYFKIAVHRARPRGIAPHSLVGFDCIF